MDNYIEKSFHPLIPFIKEKKKQKYPLRVNALNVYGPFYRIGSKSEFKTS